MHMNSFFLRACVQERQCAAKVHRRGRGTYLKGAASIEGSKLFAARAGKDSGQFKFAWPKSRAITGTLALL
eukprot:6214529-Pleurochrysis_carterae.AAC.3